MDSFIAWAYVVIGFVWIYILLDVTILSPMKAQSDTDHRKELAKSGKIMCEKYNADTLSILTYEAGIDSDDFKPGSLCYVFAGEKELTFKPYPSSDVVIKLELRRLYWVTTINDADGYYIRELKETFRRMNKNYIMFGYKDSQTKVEKHILFSIPDTQFIDGYVSTLNSAMEREYNLIKYLYDIGCHDYPRRIYNRSSNVKSDEKVIKL